MWYQLKIHHRPRSVVQVGQEKLVLAHLQPQLSSLLGSLQFAYQPTTGVDDAVIHLLHQSFTHLEDTGSTVRILFFYFSSAHIVPTILKDKLKDTGVDHHLILDYLTKWAQNVRIQDCVPDKIICSTGVQ